VILTDLHYGGDPPPARSVLVTINVIPAPPSRANISVLPASIEANGVSTSTITLSNLRDGYNNDASLGDPVITPDRWLPCVHRPRLLPVMWPGGGCLLPRWRARTP
jgi:hypothetical protein